jgi:predicted methyltransferase
LKTFDFKIPGVDISSKNSLAHLGSLDSFDITEGGVAAAGLIVEFIDSARKDKDNPMFDNLMRAADIYGRLIPNENFGGEYTALQWLCRTIILEPVSTDLFSSYPEVKTWYEFLTANEYEKLRNYLILKYHFEPVKDEEERKELRFLEDLILFSNPDRVRWENSDKNIPRLGIKPGMTVIDVGAGSGYFSLKFSGLVGETGKVYAIETNPKHLEYLNNIKRRYSFDNLLIANDLDFKEEADAVFMCSLYHILYSTLNEPDRRQNIAKIINALAPDGRLIIVDNDLVEDGEIPYHGPYIAKNLITRQLEGFGFRLIEDFNFAVQRFVLIFEYIGKENAEKKYSLVRHTLTGTLQSTYTPEGKKAAGILLNALEGKADFADALKEYRRIIPMERIGDEYTVYEWLCELIINGETPQDEFTRNYYNVLTENNFEFLKKYINAKYEFGEPMPNIVNVSEWVAFSNPARDRWEETEKMLEFIGVKEGESIADVGAGSGFFTWRFSETVGERGTVYATELNEEALSYVKEFNKSNVKTVVGALNNANLPENSADSIFICSAYHAVYVASIEFVKDAFIESLKSALKPGGRLIIVDNDIESSGIPPYYGSAIAKELVIGQLEHYGFKLLDYAQFIPQRYVLIFEPPK